MGYKDKYRDHTGTTIGNFGDPFLLLRTREILRRGEGYVWLSASLGDPCPLMGISRRSGDLNGTGCEAGLPHLSSLNRRS